MLNILIRTDSSSTIGTGHIMRDLVLAEQFLEDNIIFATQDFEGNINHKVVEKNYEIKNLNSNTFEELNSLVKKLHINMIIIDHYGIDYKFEKTLKENNPDLKIFVFDDTYERHYCDILLNHNVYAEDSQYKDLVPSRCELRCGAKYTLLREEFRVEKEKGRQNKADMNLLNIFIAMGGADHSNINIKILEVLKEFTYIHAHVVTTNANQHLKQLQLYVEKSQDVTLYLNTNKIASLMNKADFAIITPSVTINEIFYLNIPFVAIKTANNQKYMYEYLENNDLFVLEFFSAIALRKKIKSLIQNTFNKGRK